jgi:hypothetical protein
MGTGGSTEDGRRAAYVTRHDDFCGGSHRLVKMFGMSASASSTAGNRIAVSAREVTSAIPRFCSPAGLRLAEKLEMPQRIVELVEETFA